MQMHVHPNILQPTFLSSPLLLGHFGCHVQTLVNSVASVGASFAINHDLWYSRCCSCCCCCCCCRCCSCCCHRFLHTFCSWLSDRSLSSRALLPRDFCRYPQSLLPWTLLLSRTEVPHPRTPAPFAGRCSRIKAKWFWSVTPLPEYIVLIRRQWLSSRGHASA